MSTLHDDALRLLGDWAAPSAAQEALRTAYAALLAGRTDACLRACRPDHLTASTAVLSADGSQVLLTLHAKAGRWFQFGGHLEDVDGSVAGGALREATEESGVAGLVLDPDPVHLDVHEVPFCGGPGTRHFDVRFVAVAPAGAQPVVSDESESVRWWPVDDLPSPEPSLHELLHLARRRLGG